MRPSPPKPKLSRPVPPRSEPPDELLTARLESGNFVAEAAARDAARRSQTQAAEVFRSVFTVVGPVAVHGIAVGATALLLAHASPELHVWLISVVWISTFLTSAAIVAGLQFARRLPLGEFEAEWNAVHALRTSATAAPPPKNA